jgi:SAM-dependent methyltransferase
MSMTCPLCANSAIPFLGDRFYTCLQCEAIFRPTEHLPDPETEKKRYDFHQNHLGDEGYRSFVRPLVDALISEQQTAAIGLDFGCGPVSVIRDMLQELPCEWIGYDPFYFPDKQALQLSYDVIVCCEVVEHFHHPSRSFRTLCQLLKPGGRLYLMTHLYDRSIDFASWYYKNDVTHVFFYRQTTMEFIGQHFDWRWVYTKGRLVVFEKDPVVKD